LSRRKAPLFDDGSRDVAVPVRLKGIGIERSRQFGDVYVALALWRGMGFEQLVAELLPADKERVAFEGEAEANAPAQRGYSRDHRGDRKQVLIALVVTFDGFPLGYEVFAGNIHDSKTLQAIVATMAGAGVDRRPRHGEQGEPGVAARNRPALHHRRAEVGAEDIRRRARGHYRLARGARWCQGQARALSRDRGDPDRRELDLPQSGSGVESGRVYQVLGERMIAGRFDALRTGHTELVRREKSLISLCGAGSWPSAGWGARCCSPAKPGSASPAWHVPCRSACVGCRDRSKRPAPDLLRLSKPTGLCGLPPDKSGVGTRLRPFQTVRDYSGIALAGVANCSRSVRLRLARKQLKSPATTGPRA
jgi:hypothetical protein